jgi:hypothetical protein
MSIVQITSKIRNSTHYKFNTHGKQHKQASSLQMNNSEQFIIHQLWWNQLHM